MATIKIKIKIYVGDHPPPHIHLHRKDRSITRVALPTLLLLSGKPLNKEELDLVIEKYDLLCEEYDRINPKKHQ